MDERAANLVSLNETPAAVTGPALGAPGRQTDHFKQLFKEEETLAPTPQPTTKMPFAPSMHEQPMFRKASAHSDSTRPDVVDLTSEFESRGLESTDSAEAPVRRKKSLLDGVEFCRKRSFQEEKLARELDLPVDYSPDGNFNLFEDSDCPDQRSRLLGKRSPLADIEASDLAEARGGTVMGCKWTADGRRVSFACKMNHRFSAYLEDLQAREGWCDLCESQFGKASRFAAENGGRLLDAELKPFLTFECSSGHQWQAPYRKALRSWCAECKRARKKLVKEILAEENKRQEEVRKNKQNRMLDEARQRMLLEQARQQSVKADSVKTFEILKEEIGKIAANYAREYVRKSPGSNYEAILETYRVLILPEKSIRMYFEALDAAKLKKAYRSYTILLHPDKNSHPKAKAAFQKILGAVDQASKACSSQNSTSSPN